ncbi:MAG: hypothetical protein H6510_00215 [Acidobacteria bacterium]|nr:hypothetical protein [Acidobacteriota bacterium]MCB9396211.1 hypothetical protein [Acidobacteriota bacterium]
MPKFSFYRTSLALYNLLIGWVIFRSLFPFPEEPVRVQSFGFCALLGLVLLAFFALRTNNRIYLWSVPIIWFMAGWHLFQFTKKLELMLLSTYLQWTCIATLPFALVYLFVHRRTWQEFNKKVREYPAYRPRFLNSGFHF